MATFLGGIFLDECKITKDKKIENMTGQKFVCVPLQQHIGAPAKATVRAGDRVCIGDVIGINDGALSCPVHATVSGTVLRIEERNSYAGKGKTKFVVIENDGAYEISQSVKPLSKKVTELSPDEIIDIVKNAGISGMGGATFPAYAKLASSMGEAKRLIINCAECEPYITADHRLILEETEKIIYGAKIILLCLGIKRATFAIEDNKRDAAKVLLKHIGKSDIFDVQILKTKYPQGDERQLCYSVTGEEIPTGKLPKDIGCVIFNAETCYAIFDAVINGMPLVSRIITVSGDCVREPKNLRVPFGTSFEDMIAFCKGFSKKPSKIISGGPMMGFAQWDLSTPASKGTGAVLALSEKEKEQSFACIRCGRCTDVCPMHLMPLYLVQFSEKNDLALCEDFNILSCMECGSCAYVCPGKVPIIDYIRSAKDKIKQKKSK